MGGREMCCEGGATPKAGRGATDEGCCGRGIPIAGVGATIGAELTGAITDGCALATGLPRSAFTWCLSGTAASAAAVGVLARRSATRSAMLTSGS